MEISFEGDEGPGVRTYWFMDNVPINLNTSYWDLETSLNVFNFSKIVDTKDSGVYTMQQIDTSFTKQQEVSASATLSVLGKSLRLQQKATAVRTSIVRT